MSRSACRHISRETLVFRRACAIQFFWGGHSRSRAVVSMYFSVSTEASSPGVAFGLGSFKSTERSRDDTMPSKLTSLPAVMSSGALISLWRSLRFPDLVRSPRCAQFCRDRPLVIEVIGAETLGSKTGIFPRRPYLAEEQRKVAVE